MTDNLTRTEPASRLATLGSVLANWRDWNLPVKLATVTLVPVIFAIVLGAMQIADQVDRASSYRRVDRLVVVNEELRSLVSALQRERTTGAVLLAARATDIEDALSRERAAADGARDGFTRAAERVTLDEEITAARYAEVRTWLSELRGIREQVSGSLIDASTTLSRYTEIIDALLRFDRALSAEAIDPGLVATSSALHDLEAIGEQIQLQHGLIGVGIVRGGLVGNDLEALRASLARFEDSSIDFHAVAGAGHTQAFERVVDERVVAGRTNLVGTIAASPPGTRIPSDIEEWNAASDAAAAGVADVADGLGRQLRDRSATLQDEASDGAGLAAVILLVALVVAIAVMFVVGRHLLRSLGVLRRTALDVAEQRLPEAVARIRDRGDDADSITLEPVAVTSLDEVGQVARAFDAVQRQALRLATEQAGLRAQYSSVFVNLSRRSQGLVQRQLHLLERLERDEEDADQLSTLFQLDHLATRMRRNNENLMVLSGSDVSRRNQRPATLADLLRAAVSEIEQYQRVVMLPPPDVLVVGYAVGDLVRLIAELLDNATVFSAPDTNVTIASHSFEDGSVCVAVLDEGIGMNQAELDEANAKLADSASIDVSTSRRMGLFVIGRLAGRHGIEVRLNGGHDVTGVRATVTVPADLVTTSQSDMPAQVAPVSQTGGGLVPFSPPVNGAVNGSHGTNGSTNGTNGIKPAPLPRRTRPANGSDIAKRLGGEPETPHRAESLFEEASDSGGVGSGFDAGSGAEAGGGPETGVGGSTDFGAGTESGAGAEAGAGSGTDSHAGADAGEGVGADGTGGSPRAGSDSNTDPRAVADPHAGTGSRASADMDFGIGTVAHVGTDSRADADSPGATPHAEHGGPASEPAHNTGNSAVGNPATGNPAAGNPAVGNPAVGNPAVGDSAARNSAAGNPAVGNSVVGDPAAGNSAVGDSAASDSAAGYSTVSEPAAGDSAVGDSAAGDSAVGNSTASGLAAGNSAAGSSAAGNPAAGDATAGNSAVGNPTTGHPATGDSAPPDGERMPLPRRSPRGRPSQDPFDIARPHTPFGPTNGPASPADGLFTSPGLPHPGEPRPPAGAPRAPQPPPRRAPTGGPRPPRPGHAAPLFTPTGPPGQQSRGRWTPRGPGTPVDPRALAETTPIFDEMVSAWFRAVTDPPRDEPAPQPQSQDEPWRFSADAGFQAAHTVSRAEPSDFTDTGLPRRNPRQNLVPGSVADSDSTPAGPPRHGKDAESVRDRLSNYRHGVRRARDHQENTSQETTLDLTGAGWRFAADVGWRAANAVSTSTPVDFTTGGLPRRMPLDNLVPGSVTPGGVPDGPPRRARAEELRGRLGSFQKGLSQGRRSLSERTAANRIPENKQQQESE